MTNSDRAHPDAIFMRFTGGEGYGFTYLDEETFAACADHFLAIAMARETEDTPEVRKQACHDQLWRVFSDPMGEQYSCKTCDGLPLRLCAINSGSRVRRHALS